MKKISRPHKVSLSLSDAEWGLIEAALRVEYGNEEHMAAITNVTRARGRLIRLALWAVCTAMIRQRLKLPFAADLRKETKQEHDEWVAGNYVASEGSDPWKSNRWN